MKTAIHGAKQKTSRIFLFLLAVVSVVLLVGVFSITSDRAYADNGDVRSARIGIDESAVVATEAQEACALSITEEEPRVRVSRKTNSIKAGSTFRFRARLVTGKYVKVTWSVSNKKLASIDKNGKLKAKLPGSIRVYAKYGAQKIAVKVKISPKKVIAIDPGHSSRIPRGSEPIAPGSSIYKAKDNSGTAGRYTRVPEYKVAMNVAKKLKTVLEKRGYKVVLTRKDNVTAVSCKSRAQIANRAKADIFIRLHCDGAASSATRGISMQSPGAKYRYGRINHKKVVRLSRCILRSTCKATGAKSKGVYYRNDLTGNNWAKMPVTLIEMGFMSNPTEDRKLVKRSYQSKLAKGIANGIDKYFGY